MSNQRGVDSSLLPAMVATAGISACTWISFHFGQNSGSVACFYLVIVVLTAYYGGFRQASLISVAAVACLDYFFNEPIFSFTVNRSSDWVDLGAFEFTALVISRLSYRIGLRELEAAAERRDASRLYQTARRILLFGSPGNPGNQIASLIRDVFELRCVVVFDAISATTWRSGEFETPDGAPGVTGMAQNAYYGDSDKYISGDWYCTLRLGVRPAGAIALCGGTMTALTASALASLAAIALERARSIENQYHAEATREAEQLRSAVLDALAHKFKTPMTIIRTAVAGLPAAGELSPLQTELLTLVDQEARRLNDLTSRLLETPALDSMEFEPQREPILLSRLAKVAIQELDQPEDRDRFRFSVSSKETSVLGNRELVVTAIAQLVDNALKYSTRGTTIEVSLSSGGSTMVLGVRSKGLDVLPCDRLRIFERFYRAPGAREYASGTGLGLSIVRTIAADHEGHAWVDGEPGEGTSFYLSLPVVQDFAQ